MASTFAADCEMQPTSPTPSSSPPQNRSPTSLPGELPDLTQRIMSMGLYEEYQKFRDGNMQWRRGLAGGARGELTAQALSAEERQTRTFLQTFFPSFEAWHWRRTASYWIAIFFTEGSLLFVLGSFFGYAGDSGWRASGNEHVNAHLVKALSVWPSLFGSVFFSCGAVLMCLETMNVMKPVGAWTFKIFHVKSIFAYLDSCNSMNCEITRVPYLASMSYFVGTCVYPVAVIANLFLHLNPDIQLFFSTIPYAIGGLCFGAGGFLECLENKVFTTTDISLPKTAALFNFTGGCLFVAGGFVLFWEDMGAQSNLLFCVGSVFYTIASSLSVIMWKDEQFGLAYLAALNHMGGQARGSFIAGNAPPESRAFSVRGIVFIHLYCIVSVVAVMNFCLALNHYFALPAVDTLARAGNEFLPFLWLHIVLLIHSAVVKTPKTQPFHAVLMAMRCVTVVIMIMAVATFVAGLMHPPPPPPDIGPPIPQPALRSPARSRETGGPEFHDLLYPW